MKKLKEENAKRVRGPTAPARPAPVQDEARREVERAPADPFGDLRRFLEEAQRREERPKPPPPKPRPTVVQKVERPPRQRPSVRPPERVMRPETLRVEKPVRRVAPPPQPQPAPEAPRPVRPVEHPLRAGFRGRRNLRAALVASEVLGPPIALRRSDSRLF